MVIDFHGWSHDDAIEEVHKIVGRIRISNNTRSVDFIVGHGTIRKDLIRVLKEYKLDPQVKLNNSGVITVQIN